MSYAIRKIQEKDNKEIEAVIRACLIEFGANHAGTAWADPDLGRFSEIYAKPGRAYFIAEDENGKLVGGVGIGELHGAPHVCELQKMYLLPKARGTGLAGKLLSKALEYAKIYYDKCYLETLPNMVAAQKFYEKHGFVRCCEAFGDTGHFACDVRYIKDL
jgi:putative acetyltransferase